jgi:hypothetical protein
MPISGLILTLEDDAAERDAAIALLRQQPELEPGQLAGRWLPVVMETASNSESHVLHDWLSSLPGVAYVDVVAVGFEELPPEGEAPHETRSSFSETQP